MKQEGKDETANGHVGDAGNTLEDPGLRGGTFILRVKRNRSEQQKEMLILEKLELPGKKKCLRVVEPETFLTGCLNGMSLSNKPKEPSDVTVGPESRRWDLPKHLHCDSLDTIFIASKLGGSLVAYIARRTDLVVIAVLFLQCLFLLLSDA